MLLEWSLIRGWQWSYIAGFTVYKETLKDYCIQIILRAICFYVPVLDVYHTIYMASEVIELNCEVNISFCSVYQSNATDQAIITLLIYYCMSYYVTSKKHDKYFL